MTRVILYYYRNAIRRYFRVKPVARIVTILLFVLVFAAIGVGAYYFFRRGFQFTLYDPYLSTAMQLYIYELFMLFVGYLVGISALITAFFSFFKSRLDAWIMTTPRFKSIPWYQYFRILTSSLWPLIVIAVPALLAMRSVFAISTGEFYAALVTITLFVALVVLAMLVILLLVARLLDLIRRNGESILTMKRVVFVLLLLVIVSSVFTWEQVFDQDLLVLFQVHDLDVVEADTAPIIARFAVFPSHIAAFALLSLQRNDIGFLEEFGKLVILFISAAGLFHMLLDWYLPLWQKLQEGAFQAKAAPDAVQRTRYAHRNLIASARSQLGAIFRKEGIIMFRDMRNLLWLGFLLTLMLIQVGLNVVLSRLMVQSQFDPALVPVTVQIVQFATVMFFMSAFVLRFAFPAFSTEHKTAWIFGSAPVDLKKLFWSKFAFYGGVFVAIGLITGLINAFLLGFSLQTIGFLVFFLIVGSVTLTSYGLSMGAIFPDFETDDPQRLSTSLPGIGFIFGALLYTLIGAAAVFVFARSGFTQPTIVFLLFSAVLSGGMLMRAPRALEKQEFVRVYS